MRLPFIQIDAFADALFSGNPAAVMPLAEWLHDSVLQAIAAENNLAETAFFVPCPDPETADFDLRWFTPGIEVALCGHATLAAGHLILAALSDMAEVRFSTKKAGVLVVARTSDGYELSLPAWVADALVSAEHLDAFAAALRTRPQTVLARGTDYFIAVFESATEVRALDPDFRSIIDLQRGHDIMVVATAPGGPGDADVVSRVFVPEAGVDEDSVTGSAHAILTPYWAARLGRDRFTAHQASKRGGTLGCRLVGDRAVLSGKCRTVIEGEFILE